MIRPTRTLVVLAGAGFGAALVPTLVAGAPWSVWAGYLGGLLFTVGLDLVLGLPPRRLAMEVRAPGAVPVGGTIPVTLSFHAPAGGPVVEALLEVAGPVASPEPARCDLGAGGEAAFELRLEPLRRGTAEIVAAWLRWTGPLRLVLRETRRPVGRSVAVVPDLRAVRADALRFFRKSDSHAGLKVEHFLGDGSEFDALREYVPGFDRRSVDWKASARHRKLLCREFRAERNQQLVLALDAGHLMSEPLGGVPRLDHAINAALRLGQVALRTGDHVGVFAFDEVPRAWVRPEAGIGSFARLHRALAGVDYAAVQTNFTLGITELSMRLRRRSLVVLFTDFVDGIAAELMVRNLDRLARRHFVLFVALRDPEIGRLAAVVPEHATDVHHAVIAAELAREREVVLSRLRRRGVPCVDALAEEVSTGLVSQYLEIKRRERIA